MKKLCYIALSMFMLLGSVNVMAAKSDKPASEMTEQQKLRLQHITSRVEEIKEMDKSTLSRAEKKEIKNELVSMKKEAKALNGGVYLSVGAIIIILLVLILIL